MIEAKDYLENDINVGDIVLTTKDGYRNLTEYIVFSISNVGKLELRTTDKDKFFGHILAYKQKSPKQCVNLTALGLREKFDV